MYKEMDGDNLCEKWPKHTYTYFHAFAFAYQSFAPEQQKIHTHGCVYVHLNVLDLQTVVLPLETHRIVKG